MKRNSFTLPQSNRGGNVFRNKRYNNSAPRKSGSKYGQYIDPTKFVNEAIAAEVVEIFVPQHKFADFDLLPKIQQNISDSGYVDPTPIQDGIINAVLQGRDAIGLANTGTGKTAAFVLPMIHLLKTNPDLHMALIVAPTRELAVQINEEFTRFAKGMQLYSALCLGGVNIQNQIRQLSRRPQVVIGTPGRLKDLTNRHVLKLDKVGFVVLDEADRMLDMGFIRDIRFLLDHLQPKRQSLGFSATLPHEVRQLLNDLLKDPITVSVRTTETSENVQQDVIHAGSKQEKLEILKVLLKKPEFDKVLVFSQTKHGAQHLSESLVKAGTSTGVIHGNKSQSQRQRALQQFKEGRVAVLVATDVAARGIDIPNVSHVINFDQPATYEDYIHRIGRTGRAGNRGSALTFVPHA